MPRRAARSLARTVRDSRERLQLTQLQLARDVGVSRSEIAEIEAGRIAIPRADVFARLADALKLPIAALLVASGYALGEGAGEVDPEDLSLFATSLVVMAGEDRRWLRDKLEEVRQLLLVRRSSRSGSRERRKRATSS
jgi:transcriptional regulator with XRE-family HTH domain